MKARTTLSFFLFPLFLLSSLCGQVYVTYHFPKEQENVVNGKTLKSRLGNQLLTFFCAYQVAQETKGVLVFTPIDVSVRRHLDPRLPTLDVSEFIRIQERLKREGHQILSIPLIVTEQALRKHDFSLAKEEFKALLTKTLRGFKKPERIAGALRVAVHVRNGFGYDQPLGSIQLYERELLCQQQKLPTLPQLLKEENRKLCFLDVQRPLKAPPLQYYVDALNHFNEQVPGDKIFYLFTDHPDRQYIMNQLNSKLTSKIDFNDPPHRHGSGNLRDLEDIMLMSCMDALIRPGQSTFSLVAEVLGEYRYVVYPDHYRWIGHCLVMDTIGVKSSGELSFFSPYSFLDS